jgi:hypothetical protein
VILSNALTNGIEDGIYVALALRVTRFGKLMSWIKGDKYNRSQNGNHADNDKYFDKGESSGRGNDAHRVYVVIE